MLIVFELEKIEYHSHGFCAAVPVTKIQENDLDKSMSTTSIAVPNGGTSVVELINIGKKSVITSLKPSSGINGHGMCMAICKGQQPSSLLVGYEDGTITLWNMTNQKELTSIKAFSDTIMCMSYDKVNNKGIVGSAGNTLKVFHIEKEGELRIAKEITLTNPGVNSIVMRVDGKLYATAGWDSNARLFSSKKDKPLAVLSFHTQSIQCLAFHVDNSLALGSRDGAVTVWSLYK